jgi:hypothetical protein
MPAREAPGAAGGWPAYCRESLTVGDSAGVGVRTLWTPRDRVARGLDPRSYAAVGNLSSREGLSLRVRNVRADPRPRHLVVCGVDPTGSGVALARLIERGIDTDPCTRDAPLSWIDQARWPRHSQRSEPGRIARPWAVLWKPLPQAVVTS